MKKHYDGLTAYKVSLSDDIITASSGNCVATILLELVNGICITDSEVQQIEYVGNQGP